MKTPVPYVVRICLTCNRRRRMWMTKQTTTVRYWRCSQGHDTSEQKGWMEQIDDVIRQNMQAGMTRLFADSPLLVELRRRR